MSVKQTDTGQAKQPIETLLRDLRILIRDRAAVRAEEAELQAPGFSPLDFLDTRENGLSRILANLLDPAGSHGQGARFLERFFHWLGLGDDWIKAAPAARVWTEMPTGRGNGQGYIDILVRCRGRALAIENKPAAADQPLQVARYLDDLAHNCRDGHCLLYLSRTGEGPSALSISADRARKESERDTLIIRGYPALIEWLQDCSECCRAPIVSAMLEGLVRHIGKYFMGTADVREQSDIVDAIVGRSGLLEPALAIVEAGQAIRIRLLEDVAAGVAAAAAKKGWFVARSDLGPEKYSALTVRFGSRSTLGLGLGTDTASFGWLYYGVNSVEGARLPIGVRKVVNSVMGSSKATDAWPAWKHVGPNDRNFPIALHADRAFWLAAQDGSLVKMIVDFADAVESGLRAARLLTAVRAR